MGAAQNRFGLGAPGNLLHLSLEYDEDIKWKAGVFNLWLDASCNFQRLDFAGLPDDFDIQVEFVTPLYGERAEPRRTPQLYRLRDAARETHMGFLAKWFPCKSHEPGNKPRVTNDAVTYTLRGDLGDPLAREHLSLRLRALCKEKRITRDIEEFRRCLKRWKRYNEDREFAGDYGVPDYPS